MPAPDDPTSYDRVPYGSLAFPQTHPDRLATMARVFGLAAAHVANCRVLELGCASGGNLIPMAFHLPGSQFVGVDLSRHQVADAHAAIEALALRNIRVEHASLVEIDRSWGEFDYIICHGVYSWVERPVQDRILQIARTNLAESGIAYVSYNTYPGWHMREMVRRMMRYHTRQFAEAGEQIQQARALLAFLAASAEPGTAYGQLLQEEVGTLQATADWYLFHEHLEQTNTPLYFSEFIERAGEAGLRYLSEAELAVVMSRGFPAGIAETLERISPDILHLEQYMDFVRNRRFRQTLLCHEEAAPKRALSPAVLHGMSVSCRASTDGQPIDLAPGTPVVFRLGERRLETTEPVTKAAFALLIEELPRAIPVDELCQAAIARIRAADASVAVERLRKTLMEQLFQCVIGNVVELHTFQAPFAAAAGARPRADRLAAYQARTQEIVVNALHETVKLDELSRTVLQLADGERTSGEIVAALVERVAAGAMQVHANDRTVTDTAAARALLEKAVDETLASLTRAALLAE